MCLIYIMCDPLLHQGAPSQALVEEPPDFPVITFFFSPSSASSQPALFTLCTTPPFPPMIGVVSFVLSYPQPYSDKQFLLFCPLTLSLHDHTISVHCCLTIPHFTLLTVSTILNDSCVSSYIANN